MKEIVIGQILNQNLSILTYKSKQYCLLQEESTVMLHRFEIRCVTFLLQIQFYLSASAMHWCPTFWLVEVR